MKNYTFNEDSHVRSPLSNPPLPFTMTSQPSPSRRHSSSPATRPQGSVPQRLRRASQKVSRIADLRHMPSLGSFRKLGTSVKATFGSTKKSTADSVDSAANMVDVNGEFLEFDGAHQNEDAQSPAAPAVDAEEPPQQPPRQSSAPGTQAPVRSFDAKPSRLNRIKSRMFDLRDEIANKPMPFRRSSRLAIAAQVETPFIKQSVIEHSIMLRFPPSSLSRSPIPIASPALPVQPRSQPALVLVNPQTTYRSFIDQVHEIIQNESFHVVVSTDNATTVEILAYFSDKVHDWEERLFIANTKELQLALRYMEMGGWKRSDWFEVDLKDGKTAEMRASEYVEVIGRRSGSIYSRKTIGETMTDMEIGVTGMTHSPMPQFGKDGPLSGRQ